MKSFTDLGICHQLVEVCETHRMLGWYDPRKIQSKVIPLVLQEKDVFAISPPRSGKTAAYVLPIFQALLDAGPNINPFFACVIAPTRFLAIEIGYYFNALCQHFDVKFAVLVATADMVHQTNKILNKPHIIVGTPGKIIRHLKDNQAFSLAKLKYLVIDETHLLVSNNKHIHKQLEFITGKIPRNRTTLLFSDSMTDEVHTIQSMYLRNPVKIDDSIEYPEQQQCHMSAEHKDCYLAYTLNKMVGKTSLVLVRACDLMLRLALTLRNFGINVIPINVFMSQAKRLEALNLFKSGDCKILLSNEGVCRGLDIPAVDVVINYDIPNNPKDYMQRVGWAAPSGVAISFVNPNEERSFEMIETHIGKKLSMYPAQNEEVLLLSSRVSEAKSLADEEFNKSRWRSGGYLGEEDVRKIERDCSTNHVKVYVNPELLETLKREHEVYHLPCPKKEEFIAVTEKSENSADGDTVVIKTSDGVDYKVERVIAVQIQKKYGLAESGTEFKLSNVGSEALETAIKLFKELQAEQKIYVGDFTDEQLKDLVVAVYHLGFSDLESVLCQVIADRLKNKSKEYMQTFFGFQEEEIKLMEEDP